MTREGTALAHLRDVVSGWNDDATPGTSVADAYRFVLAEINQALAALQSAPVSSSSVEEAREALDNAIGVYGLTPDTDNVVIPLEAVSEAVDALIASVRAEGAQTQEASRHVISDLGQRLQDAEAKLAEKATIQPTILHNPVCGCGHFYHEHDAKTGKCSGRMVDEDTGIRRNCRCDHPWLYRKDWPSVALTPVCHIIYIRDDWQT